jgi:hypothetical protein
MDGYEKNAIEAAEKHGLTMEILSLFSGKHFEDDVEKRDIYLIRLAMKDKEYIFEYGDSIINSKKANKKNPSMYDALSCLQKCDVGNFEDFCSDFGFNSEPISQYNRIKKLYNDLRKEYEGFSELFDNGEIPEDILEIC